LQFISVSVWSSDHVLPTVRQASGSRCASKMNIKCTLAWNEKCAFCGHCSSSVRRQFPSICCVGYDDDHFHAVGMGLRHYPSYWEIRICEEHTRTAGCVPTTHESNQYRRLVFKRQLHSCHVFCATHTQSATLNQLV
jgi:hypothetical protein